MTKPGWDERRHISEDDLLLFSKGTIEQERRPVIEQHLSLCAACHAAFMEAGTFLATLERGSLRRAAGSS